MTDLLAARSLMAMSLGFHLHRRRAGADAPVAAAVDYGAVVLFPSRWHLLRVFKRRALFSHDGPPPSGGRQPEGRHT